VLRLCSVFEPPDEALTGRGVRFDPVGGMQSHTGQLTRALDRRGVRQTVVTHRPPGAPRQQRIGEHAVIHRFGLPVARAQLYRRLEEFFNLNLYDPRVKIGPTRVVK